METNNRNWYAVITADILYNKQLSDKQKLLIAVISNLSNEKGYCFASNQYLADVLDCDKLTISRHISAIEKLGLISKVIILDDNGAIKHRVLTPIHAVGNHGVFTESSIGVAANDNMGIDENVNYNNKEYKNKYKKNNICGGIDFNSDILIRMEEFEMNVNKIEMPGLTPEIRENFISYWTETNKTGKKMRFEAERFFDLKKRISTFIKNDRKSWKSKNIPVSPTIDPNNVW